MRMTNKFICAALMATLALSTTACSNKSTKHEKTPVEKSVSKAGKISWNDFKSSGTLYAKNDCETTEDEAPFFAKITYDFSTKDNISVLSADCPELTLLADGNEVQVDFECNGEFFLMDDMTEVGSYKNSKVYLSKSNDYTYIYASTKVGKLKYVETEILFRSNKEYKDVQTIVENIIDCTSIKELSADEFNAIDKKYLPEDRLKEGSNFEALSSTLEMADGFSLDLSKLDIKELCNNVTKEEKDSNEFDSSITFVSHDDPDELEISIIEYTDTKENGVTLEILDQVQQNEVKVNSSTLTKCTFDNASKTTGHTSYLYKNDNVIYHIIFHDKADQTSEQLAEKYDSILSKLIK